MMQEDAVRVFHRDREAAGAWHYACGRNAFSSGYFPYYLYRQSRMAGNLENIGWTKPGAAGTLQYLYDGGVPHDFWPVVPARYQKLRIRIPIVLNGFLILNILRIRIPAFGNDD